MQLFEILGIDLDKNSVISVVGGGGKTTTILMLGGELKEIGKKVLITTSTAIFIPDNSSYHDLFIKEVPKDFSPQTGTVTYYAEEKDEFKLKTKKIALIEEIIKRKIFDFVLIEADGSKGMPIKAPASHEPVISRHTSLTIGVIGLDSLGTEINNINVHRPELLKKLINDDINKIDINVIVKLVLNENGLFKNCYGKKILLLNKANNTLRISQAIVIKEKLKDTDIGVVIGDVKSSLYIS